MPEDESTQEPKKRSRTMMTAEQSQTLMKYFEINQFPSTEVREELSRMLGMKPRTVQIWFQNQRQKAKNRASRTLSRKIKYRDKGQPYEDDYGKLHLLASVASDRLDERRQENRAAAFGLKDQTEIE